MDTILKDNPGYPRRLAAVADAPEALYALGEAPLNAPHTIAIVGTRSATPYALRFINSLVDSLAAMLPRPVIVSGLAMGCDIMAHRRAVERGLPTVAVLAHGLQTLYPASHTQFARSMVEGRGGMLLTAYPDGTPVHRANFLARNKIIAGISDCVVVAESASDRGGALHTARYAASIGRRVFACPGRIGDRYSAGCNMLIRQGTATLCESADDLVHAMGWQAATSVPEKEKETVQQTLFAPAPKGTAATIADYLTGHPDSTADNIAAALSLPMSRVLSTLMEMEFLDQIITLPGNRFRNA